MRTLSTLVWGGGGDWVVIVLVCFMLGSVCVLCFSVMFRICLMFILESSVICPSVDDFFMFLFTRGSLF